MIASEVQPFAKTGGLADVASALPRALGGFGHDVTVVTPRYRGIEAGARVSAHPIRVGDFGFDAGFFEEPLGPAARAIFVDCPPLYARRGIYNEHNVDYADNALRYAFLTVAALEWAFRQPQPPSIVHAHDWQTGLTPVYLQTRFATLATHAPTPRRVERRRTDNRAAPVAPVAPDAPVPCLFTIHNLAYQGIFDKAWVPRLGLGWDRYTVRGFEFWDRLSFLKAGVNFGDLITTVSSTYAAEIQRPEYGYGFDGVMRARRDSLIGILNGIDAHAWDPTADRYLPAPFSRDDLSGKRAAKRALLEAFGLPVGEDALARPVVGMVSRMVDQKGFDLVEAVAGQLPDLGAAFVVLGSGDPRYQDLWARLTAWRPDVFAAFIGFDERRAHLVEAGSDVLLMPSRYEPCGLNQMYSMRYGSIPIVRRTGGLADSVRMYDRSTRQGTGIVFEHFDVPAMRWALETGLSLHADQEHWPRLVANAMAEDFSWDRPVQQYLQLYEDMQSG
jgi:starch synthase